MPIHSHVFITYIFDDFGFFFEINIILKIPQIISTKLDLNLFSPHIHLTFYT